MSKAECKKAYLKHKLAMDATMVAPKMTKVSEIFTRKPYSASADLGKLLKRKKAKAAEKARHHRYYEAHKEEQVGKLRGWRDANRDKLHEEQKRYREKHAEELRVKRRAYYEANKEHIKARIKANYYKRKEQNEPRRDNERLTESE